MAPNVRPRGGASTAGNTPTDRGTETPGPEPSSMSLPEKIEAARRRIAELEEQERMRIELETMEAQIRQLEGQNTSTGALRTPVAHTTTHPIRRAPKTRELPTYKGKNIKEAQDFFYQAELKWREDNDITWTTDAAKVTHCASCFEGIARDIWKRREKTVGVDNTSWEDFVEFMKNSISDPENRNLDAIGRLDKAQQRPNQSVQNFVSYLDSLEDDLGTVDATQSRNNLLAKLRPDIRDEIDRRDDIPAGRERLIALAVRIENRLEKRNRNSNRHDEPTGQRMGRDDSRDRRDHRRDRGRTQSPRREPHLKREDGVATTPNNISTSNTKYHRNVTCFRCNKEGHYATACPALACHNCKKLGHKAYMCPEPKKSGNGSAPQ